MTVKMLNGPIIRAGESLSDPLDGTAGQLVRIHMPAAWNGKKQPPPLTFQISHDGSTWLDLFGVDGFEVSIKTVVPSSAALMQDNQVRNVWLRFRSGSRADPQPQEAERVFSVGVDVDGGAAWVYCYVPGYGWMWLSVAP